LCTLPGHQHMVLSVAFSSDGKRVVSGAWEDNVRIWDAAIGPEVSEYALCLSLFGLTSLMSRSSFPLQS
jgi:WD40 repeat protein